MQTETIILIVSNIVVPIVVALITGIAQAKKYKKEIQLLNYHTRVELKKFLKSMNTRLKCLNLSTSIIRNLNLRNLGILL